MTAESFGPEQAVHGSTWGRMHGGYFSDPAVARPLVEAIHGSLREAHPDAIVDLGGGTGYLLDRVRAAGVDPGIRLTVLEGSAPQLAEAKKNGLDCVQGSVAAFRRADVVPTGSQALWTMRSVLHYSGERGLNPLLRHLRAQARPGEFWIHQTACFGRAEDAACLNALYQKMRTVKWYPVTADLRSRLNAAGWTVLEMRPAPTLALGSGELGLRYGLDKAELRRIGAEMAREFGGRSAAFRSTRGGFQADLHYRICICQAAPVPCG